MKNLLCKTCREKVIREIETKGSFNKSHHVLRLLDRLNADIAELNYHFEQEI